MSTFKSTTTTTTTTTTAAGKDGGFYVAATRHILNVKDAQLYVQRGQLQIARDILFAFLLILASLFIYVGFEIWRVSRDYADFIAAVNTAQLQRGCNGLWLAMCLEYPFLNRMLGCSANAQFAPAAWILWYSRDFRQQLMVQFNTTNSVAAFAQALSALQMAADKYTSGYSAINLACLVANGSSTSTVAQDCYPVCKLSYKVPGTNAALASAQGSFSMAASGAGMGMMFGGVGALVGAGIGALAGLFMGASEAASKKAKAIQECDSYRTTCYLPQGFPSCDNNVSE